MEIFLKELNPDTLTYAFVLLMLLVFLIACGARLLKRWHSFTDYAATLLTSLGILGTFVGIVVGLLNFNVTHIDTSINALLDGLKTAFITSIVGTGLAIIFRGFVVPLIGSKTAKDQIAAEEVSAWHLLEAIQQQSSQLELLRKTLGEDNDSSMIGQIKLLRSDLNDHAKQLSRQTEPVAQSLQLLQRTATEQQTAFHTFEDRLWIKLQDFADMMSKSATEQVVNALKETITSFNDKLTEQFGENFKQLNESVKELVVWQDNYKQQIFDMMEQYRLGVASIQSTEQSVSKISDESRSITESMEHLQQVIGLNQQELVKLGDHLLAFQDIRDRAVEAVPQIRQQLDLTIEQLTQSVLAINQHHDKLIQESDQHLNQHLDSSRELIAQFIENTRTSTDHISTAINDNLHKVEQEISLCTQEFRQTTAESNQQLIQSSEVLSQGTLSIRQQFSDNAKALVQLFTEESEAMTATLQEANQDLSESIQGHLQKVGQEMTTCAQEFRQTTSESNQQLLKSSEVLSQGTESIRQQFSDNAKALVQVFINESQALATSLQDANKALVTDTGKARDLTLKGIEDIRDEFDHAIENMVTNLNKNMLSIFTNIDSSLKEQVAKTGTAVDKQVGMLDESMNKEVDRVLTHMGQALASISNQFTNDYSKLVARMQDIVNRAGDHV